MDFHLKQPVEKQQRQKHESDEEQQQPSPAKFPRLHLQLQSHPQQQSPSNLNSFLPYPSDSKPPLPPRSPGRIGGFFSTDQWQELELQALIFRHMVAGAAIPIELLQLVKKSLINSSPFNLNNSFSYYHPPLLQGAGCWAKGALDPEPGRCRRTDGKKWRCSREVVVGHKYCERHVHRGRNRSRKPVESAAASGTPFGRGGGGGAVTGSDLLGVGTSKQYAGLVEDGARFSLSGPTPSLDIFQLHQGFLYLKNMIKLRSNWLVLNSPNWKQFKSGSEPNSDGKFLFKAENDTSGDNESKLRPFFDDWPKPNSTSVGGASHTNSATCLSISTPGVNSSVDFLKLSTGNGGDQLSRKADGEWSGGNQVAAAAGGPLAEALRSSPGGSTSGVLHQLPRSASDSSCVTA